VFFRESLAKIRGAGIEGGRDVPSLMREGHEITEEMLRQPARGVREKVSPGSGRQAFSLAQAARGDGSLAQIRALSRAEHSSARDFFAVRCSQAWTLPWASQPPLGDEPRQ
jgi:hypothetical protein